MPLQPCAFLTMALYTDQMGRTVVLPHWPPQRIVSLVPSQTELLFELGLGDKIVGLTKFCIHPSAQCRQKDKIGGTKKLHISKIIKLQPDLIIGNKEENEKSDIAALEALFPVWMSHIITLQDALDMIIQIGQITDTAAQAGQMTQHIRKAFAILPQQPLQKPSVVYLIWRKPYMAAGGLTFINEMLELAGFDNLLKKQERYPVLADEDLRQLSPQVILLSSEPYPFNDKHVAEIKKLSPTSVVLLTNGEAFSWYGSRLLSSASYLADVCRTASLLVRSQQNM